VSEITAADDVRYVLSATGITVRFGGVTALSDVSIGVRQGAITGLVGPNGAGKTTLFDVLSGLRRPDAGAVDLLGEDVTGISPQARAIRGLARTFQHPELFMSLTVREHLSLGYRARHQRSRLWQDMFTGAAFRRQSQEELDRSDSLLELLGLTAIANQRVSSLPLGNCRLVEVGRALAYAPSVLLLDEPLSGLDSSEARRLAQALRLVVDAEDTTLLLVEHDVDMVMSLSSHVIVLDFGVVLAEGTPAEVRSNDRVRAAYLGEDEPAATTPSGTSSHEEIDPA
jgi:ABC-type branched-subunit amino acid transport system ATPase component